MQLRDRICLQKIEIITHRDYFTYSPVLILQIIHDWLNAWRL